MTTEQLKINPLCNIIVGFRNKKIEKVRTKYIVFDLPAEKAMADCLLKISCKQIKDNNLDHCDPRSINWLIDYGFLKPAVQLTFKQKLKTFFKDILNENKYAVYSYHGKQYNVTSYVFMALTSKKSKGFIKDRIILPYWSKKLSTTILNFVTAPSPTDLLPRLPRRLRGKMIAKGLLLRKKDDIFYAGFCKQYCSLDKEIVNYLPALSTIKDNHVISRAECWVNKDIIWQNADTLNTVVANKIINKAWISNNLPTVWLSNPKIDSMIFPYWLNDNDANTLKSLNDGQLTIEQVAEETLSLFYQADLITDDKKQLLHQVQWEEKIRSASDDFKKLGFFTVQDIYPPMQIAILRKYVRAMLKNELFLHDKIYGGTKKRFWQHNDGLTYFIQEQIGLLISHITGHRVKPASAALTTYQPEGKLPKHKDDIVAYSYVMSLVVDTNPETSRDDAWPLCVIEKGTEYSSRMSMGDGMVINPQSLHWRPDALANHMLSIMLLWYVPHDYTGYINGKWIA